MLALVMGSLLISNAVMAQVHHEDYDKAETDLASLTYYLGSSFIILNETLSNVRDLRIEDAQRNEVEFTMMIASARETLSKIPQNIDSYEKMNSSIFQMGFIDEHLSILVEGLDTTMDARSDLDSYSFEDWSPGPLRENISRADLGMIRTDQGTTNMSLGKEELLFDMEILKGSNLFEVETGNTMDLPEPSDIIEVLEDIEITISRLKNNKTSMENVLAGLMMRPMESWEGSIRDILEEGDPINTLIPVIEVLSAANSGHSDDMQENLTFIIDELNEASAPLSGTAVSQSTFLQNITILEEEEAVSLSISVVLYESCLRSIVDMEDHSKMSGLALDDLERFDNGSIRSALGDLETLIVSYRERLDLVEYWKPDIGSIADRIDSAILSNVLQADIDGNMTLEDEEVLLLTMDLDLFVNLSELARTLKEISENILSLPGDSLPEVRRVIPIMQQLVNSVEIFSVGHRELLEKMKGYASDVTRENGSLYKELRYSLSRISFLRGSLLTIFQLRGDLEAFDLLMNSTWKVPLNEQLDLYSSYILRKGYKSSNPEIFLTVDEAQPAYDTGVGISLIFIDLDQTLEPYLPSGVSVDISIDNETGPRIELIRGSGSGRMMIDRSMEAGPHDIRAEAVSSNGTSVSASLVLTIRKLETRLSVSPAHQEVLLGRTTSINVEVKDELLRSVQAEVLIGNDDKIHQVPDRVNIGPFSLGSHEIPVVYPGDDIFQPSNTSFTVEVRQKPEILLSSNSILFGRNDTIELSVSLMKGNGSIALEMGPSYHRLGPLVEGNISSISLNPFDIGNGTYIVRAFLDPTDNWTRSGYSNIIEITIDLSFNATEPGEGSKPDDPENETDNGTIEIPFVEEPTGNEPFLSQTIQWALFAVVCSVIIISSIFVISRFRRKRDEKKDRSSFGLPSIYLGRYERIPTDDKKPEIEMEPGTERTPPGRFRTDRDRLIEHYLDLIGSSPHEAGLRDSMTPREVQRRLVDDGVDERTARELSFDFETSIYRKGEPEKGVLDRFNEDRGKVLSLLSSIFSVPENDTEEALR